MKRNHEEYLRIARYIAREAGSFLNKNFGTIKEMKSKEKLHYAIKEDAETNNIYEEYLKNKTPEVSLYTEEGEKNLGELTWIIDPIEGTSNYRVGNPFFATQICLLEKNEPVVSVVLAPKLSQEFSAVKDNGAYSNGKKIYCSDTKELNMAVVSFGRGRRPEYTNWYINTIKNLLPAIRTPRTFGSCGLEMAYTACGMMDVFINNGAHLYDYAAGTLLLKEAGCCVLNMHGENWKYTDSSVVAANPGLAEKVLSIVKGS